MARRQVPVQKPGKSEQSVGTPIDFLDAVRRRFGTIVRDLAADIDNAVTPRCITVAGNSLVQPWAEDDPTGLLWLNPPFSDIRPWARKCAVESKMRHGLIVMLTPGGVSTNWFHDHVAPNAYVLDLNPRLRFIGHDQDYPKDLILSVFGYGLVGRAQWQWKERKAKR